MLALWKGVTPSLGSAFIENAVVFSANGMIRRFYLGTLSGEHFSPGEERHLTVKERAMVGGAAGILSATVCCGKYCMNDVQLLISDEYECTVHYAGRDDQSQNPDTT